MDIHLEDDDSSDEEYQPDEEEEDETAEEVSGCSLLAEGEAWLHRKSRFGELVLPLILDRWLRMVLFPGDCSAVRSFSALQSHWIVKPAL